MKMSLKRDLPNDRGPTWLDDKAPLDGNVAANRYMGNEDPPMVFKMKFPAEASCTLRQHHPHSCCGCSELRVMEPYAVGGAPRLALNRPAKKCPNLMPGRST